jgi:hypothetical protein
MRQTGQDPKSRRFLGQGIWPCISQVEKQLMVELLLFLRRSNYVVQRKSSLWKQFPQV